MSFKLKKERVRNPRERWVRRDGAFEAVVDPQEFFIAHGLILARHQRLTDEHLLDKLTSLFHERQRLSGLLIDETEGMPSSSAYRHRFGSLVRAYQLVGYTPARDFAFIEINRELRRIHPEIVEAVVRAVASIGGRLERDEKTDLLVLNGKVTLSVVLARHEPTGAGGSRWTVRLDRGLAPDLTIAVRMDSTNRAALDYYVFPLLDTGPVQLRLAEENRLDIGAYRFGSLQAFAALVEETRIEVAA